MPFCTECGKQNPENARFCLACGAAIAAPAPEVRKTVTILRCDLTGSTALGERLDSESLRRVQSRYFDEARSVLERHGGTVEKFIGDAVVAVFGVPQLHEDDALRAVRAAADLRHALAALNEDLDRKLGVRVEIRTGVTTGEVTAGDPSSRESFVTGDPANVAARLEQAAKSGEILIGEPTYRLVSAAVDVEAVPALAAKGKREPVQAWRLIGVRGDAEGFVRRRDAPLVGREQELDAVRKAFRDAADQGTAQLVTLLGEPGIGKSRIADEFAREAVREATVVRGRCLPYGERITYSPLVEIVRQARRDSASVSIRELLGDDPQAQVVAERLATAVGESDSEATADEVAWAARRLFERLARERPLIVVVDDLQWAEAAFLDLLEHIAYFTRTAPVLLLCQARPEILHGRPSWPGTRVQLGPLTARESDTLVASLLAQRMLDEGKRRQILSTASGNPLFIEQMLAVAESLDRDEALVTPPTIHALLDARLDRLQPRLRSMLARASVVGERFSTGALLALEPPGSGISSALMELVREELVEPVVLAYDDATFRFAHVLLREAAYGTLAKEVRAELHERLARWLEAGKPDNVVEEVVAYHLEQAYRHRAELGLLDDRTQALGREAAELLAAAAHRVWGLDLKAITSLLARATELLPRPDRLRADMLVTLGDAVAAAGDFEEAEAHLAEALAEAEALSDRRVEARARLERAYMRQITDRRGLIEMHPVAMDAIAVFQDLGDDALLARAWNVVARAHGATGRPGPQQEALERALAHATRAGDERRAMFSRHHMTVSRLNADGRVDDVLEEAERQLHLAGQRGFLAIECASFGVIAECRAMQGRFDDAREASARFHEMFHRSGRATSTELAGAIELLAGEPARAEEALHPVEERHRALGDRGHGTWSAWLLARALLELGRDDEAESICADLEERAPIGELAADVQGRAIRARVLARRRRHAEAETLANEAASLVASSGWLSMTAQIELDRADVFRLSGQVNAAAAAAAEALRLSEAKGNVVFAARARDVLERLAVVSANT